MFKAFSKTTAPAPPPPPPVSLNITAAITTTATSSNAGEVITPESVLKMSAPSSKFFCAVNKTSLVQFLEFKIRDIESNSVLFDVKRPMAEFDPNETDSSDEEARSVSYSFHKGFFDLKTIGTTLTFAVGAKPLDNFRMIERHYFQDKLLKSFDFQCGFCMPNSVNTMENVYEIPKLDAKTKHNNNVHHQDRSSSCTGNQGGSVLSHLLKSPKASSFSLTGVSRNPESDAAKVIAAKGVTMVKGDFADKASLLAAFQGADIVFANTDFWAVKANKDVEVAQGKNIADAAAEAKIKFLIYSGLPNCSTISKGKYSKVLHFDGKAEILAYMQSKVPGTISVEPGYYITNAKKAPNADGVLEWQTVVNPETLVPAMHIESYYGAAVAKVCEDPEKYKGRRLFVAGEYTSLKNMYAVIAASLGKKHTLTQVPRETYVAGLAKYTGPVVAEELTEMHEFFEEFGYYGGEPLSMAELGLKGTSVKDWISMEEAKALFK